MNTYKVTFTRENGTVGTDCFTAATERQAMKEFNAVYRHGCDTVANQVELINTDTPATKEQERKALEKIRKIIAELGDNSYIGTAFKGCLQDAENNIEDDAAYSMQSRYEYSEEKLAEAQKEIKQLKERLAENEKTYEAARAAAQEISEKKDAEIKALQERVLSADDLADVIQIISDKRFEYEIEIENAADRIVETATESESAEFKNAVAEHRAAKKDMEYATSLLKRLYEVQS